MPPPNAIRALHSIRTLLEHANQLSPQSHSPSSNGAFASTEDGRLPSSSSILYEVFHTYISEMTQSELLFFLSIAVAIVLFGIVLPVWEAISSSSSNSTSKKKMEKSVWHKSYDDYDTHQEEDYYFGFDKDNDTILMETPPCQLKMYVPGTGVVLLTDASASSSSHLRRGSSVGSNGSSHSAWGSWCMETIEESEEEDISDDEDESDDSRRTSSDTTTCGSCPDLDETTAEDDDDDDDDAD